LDTYFKCGSIKDASKFFEACPKKDLIIFTTMVGRGDWHFLSNASVEYKS